MRGAGLGLALVFILAACGGSERSAGSCLHLRAPEGGRAEERPLRGLLRCTLTRRDGSLFARLTSDDRERLLSFSLYRRNGALRESTGMVYAATPQDTSATVKCGSASQKPIGPGFWRKTRNWSVGSTPKGLDRAKVIKALKAAMQQWVNNVNHCGLPDKASPPMAYKGETSKKSGQDGVSVVDWSSLQSDADCKGALACTVTAYDSAGNPVESDTRFNTFYAWSTTGAKNAYDVQSVAAHEWGHILQLDHSQNAAKNDNTLIMWPYVDIGDTSGRKLGKGDAQANNTHY